VNIFTFPRKKESRTLQTLRLHGQLLPDLLETLKTWGTLWAPIERSDNVFELGQIDSADQARPDALRTILPFKKLLLPPSFAMLEGTACGAPRQSLEREAHSTVFFGAHPCDIHALRILDLLYLSNYVDPFYQRSRDALVVVGYGCWPDEHCFCDSLDTSSADGGFDLFLTPLDGRHLVAVGSSRGDDIVRSSPHLFEPATRDDAREYLERIRARRSAFQLELDTTDLPFILDLKSEDPVWHELGKKCLCCGSCSMVCPTCTCFNVVDEIGEAGVARRTRLWDSCLYPDYAVVAGGHNFRADRADRVRNRYYHKHEAFVREFGMPSCVGCGRCIENCPTGIDVVEVFRHVRGDT
jgi:sulfhydrogenase subunit beta (sulfur reductase)